METTAHSYQYARTSERARAFDTAKAAGFRLRKIQREVGCEFCIWFDLEAAIQEKPYCKAPVKCGDMTIEVYFEDSAIWHRCHKFERIGGPSEATAPILDNGGRNVANIENREVTNGR